MRLRFASAVALLGIAAAACAPAQTPGCVPRGTGYKCDQQQFERVLRAAKTVSVQVPRMSSAEARQLRKLARSLGKTTPAGPSDLTFVLVRPDSPGVYIGPANRNLAEIRVYRNSPGAAPASLVWIERYYGQPGDPWPIVVHRLANQFRRHFRQENSTGSGRPLR